MTWIKRSSASMRSRSFCQWIESDAFNVFTAREHPLGFHGEAWYR
jgi:hypothetical protein